MQKTKIWYARALLNDSTNTGTRLYHCIKWNFERTSALSFHYICHYIKHNLGRKLARRRRKILGGFKVICTSELYSREENKPAAGGIFLEVFKCFTLRKCIFSEGIRVFQRSKSSKFSACGGLRLSFRASRGMPSLLRSSICLHKFSALRAECLPH